jgi:serine/threonine protein kinase
MHIEIGTIVDSKYEVLAELGSGATATVVLARQSALNRLVAIKFMRSLVVPALRQRFEREAIILSKLRHPNVVAVYSHGIWQDVPYLVMEYIEGTSLANHARNLGCIPAEDMLVLTKQVCAGLEHLHQNDIIHRDLKPDNIMLTGERCTLVKLVDLGFAKIVTSGHAAGAELQKLTEDGVAVGTVLYMSPEQCKGMPFDQRSDIYSVGIILQECLTGKLPHNSSDPFSIMFAHVELVPAKLTDACPDKQFPDGLQGLISKAIQKNPDDRYSSCNELIRDIELIETGRGRLIANELPQSYFQNVAGATKSKLVLAIAVAATLISIGYIALADPGVETILAPSIRFGNEHTFRASLERALRLLNEKRPKGAVLICSEARQLADHLHLSAVDKADSFAVSSLAENAVGNSATAIEDADLSLDILSAAPFPETEPAREYKILEHVQLLAGRNTATESSWNRTVAKLKERYRRSFNCLLLLDSIVVQRMQAIHGPSAAESAEALDQLAAILGASENHISAIRTFEQASQIYEQRFGRNSSEYFLCQLRIAEEFLADKKELSAFEHLKELKKLKLRTKKSDRDFGLRLRFSADLLQCHDITGAEAVCDAVARDIGEQDISEGPLWRSLQHQKMELLFCRGQYSQARAIAKMLLASQQRVNADQTKTNAFLQKVNNAELTSQAKLK